jgi:uncharacterized protein
MNYLRSLLFCSWVLFLGNQAASAQEEFLPEMTGWINDYGKILNSKQVEELTSMVRKYAKHTDRGIILLTVDSIKPYDDLHLFAEDVVDYWKMERRFLGSSLIFAVCIPCHKISFATGFGSGDRMKEAECKKIMDEIIIPEFKKEDYYLGIKNGIKAIMEKWKEK